MVFLNIFIRLIGLTYDILLSRILGAEAIGLFEISISTLMLFIIIINSGTSTTITKLVAENNSKNNNNSINQIFKDALFMNLITSIFLGVFVIFFSRYIAVNILKNDSILFGVYLLVPAIIIISISSVYKSYFYGLKNIVVPSIGEIIEGLAKFIFVMLLIISLCPIQPIIGATIAILGISIGEAFNVIWYLYSKSKLDSKTPKNYDTNKQSFIPKILVMSLPLTLSGLLSAAIRFANTILIPNKLMSAGYSSSEAVATIGRIMGMTMPLIGLPFIVTNALVVNLIPSLTEQVAQKRYREIKADIQLSFKATLLVSIPLSAIYIILSEPLAVFLYNDILVSEYIRIMGFATILLGLQHNLAGILYGINKQNIATFNRLIGMVTQVLITYSLVGNPNFGPLGIFISYYASFIVVMFLDIMTLKKLIKFNLNYIDILGKPLFASAFMIILIYVTNYDLGNLQNTNTLLFFLSLVVGALSYIFILILTKAIPKNLFKKLLKT